MCGKAMVVFLFCSLMTVKLKIFKGVFFSNALGFLFSFYYVTLAASLPYEEIPSKHAEKFVANIMKSRSGLVHNYVDGQTHQAIFFLLFDVLSHLFLAASCIVLLFSLQALKGSLLLIHVTFEPFQNHYHRSRPKAHIYMGV